MLCLGGNGESMVDMVFIWNGWFRLNTCDGMENRLDGWLRCVLVWIGWLGLDGASLEFKQFPMCWKWKDEMCCKGMDGWDVECVREYVRV